MKIRSSFQSLLPLTATLAIVCSADAAQPAATRHEHFAISAQALGDALRIYADQTGEQVVFFSELGADQRSSEVYGEYTREQALDKLLQKTGLTFERLNDKTIAITPNRASQATFSQTSLRLAQAGQTASAGGSQRSESLDEVTVTARRATTATKTDASLTEIPQAISVITSAQITDRGATLYEEAMRYSAGVAAEPYGVDSRNASTSIRGFTAVEYLDGMRRQWGFLNFARTDVFTLERLEVLRGPSSVLYGAGTAGGLVNQVSKRPQFETGGSFGVQYGSFDRKQAQVDVTGPLAGSNAIAGRLIAVARESDTQVDFNRDDRLLLAPSLTWQAGADTTVTLLASWTEDRLNSSAQLPPLEAALLAPPGRRLPDSFFAGEPGFDRYDVDQTSATLTLDHAFSESLTLASAARFVKSKTRFNSIYPDSFADKDELTPGRQIFIDPAAEVMDRYFEIGEQRAEAFTTDHRLLLAAATGPLTHSILVGVDYQSFRQETRSTFGNAAPLNVYRPAYGNIPSGTPERQPTQWVSQTGVYLQDQIKYGERTFIVLGARHDRAKTDSEGPPEQIDSENTFRAALIVAVGGGFSPYVSYAESFLPVAGSVGTDGVFVSFQPQLGTQYELGVKWQPNPRTLATLALFDIKETNRFTNHPTDAFAVVQQGEVQSKGIELELSHELPQDFNLSASYSYVNAEISRSNTPAEVGVQLDVTPEHQGTFWGVKRFSLADRYEMRFGAGVRYIGDSISSGGGATLDIPAITLVDALLGLDWQQWSLSITASNLTDKQHYSTCLVRGDCWTGARRNIIGSASYRF